MVDFISLPKKTKTGVISSLKRLGYGFFGSSNNKNIFTDKLIEFWNKLNINQGIQKVALDSLIDSSKNTFGSKCIDQSNKFIYEAICNGLKIKLPNSKTTATVPLVDWDNFAANSFYLAEDVFIAGQQQKLDLVVYVNGIAMSIITLSGSGGNCNEFIQRHIDYQQKQLFSDFYATAQLLVAIEPSQGLFYGVINNNAEHYIKWKSDACSNKNNYLSALDSIFSQKILLDIIKNFISFNHKMKFIARPNQYFAINAVKDKFSAGKGGILWHVDGAGKSLIVSWLARWLVRDTFDYRVLVFSDRLDLCNKLQLDFKGTSNKLSIVNSFDKLLAKLVVSSGDVLFAKIKKLLPVDYKNEVLDDLILNLQNEILPNLKSNFKPQGKFVVFIDECHQVYSAALCAVLKNVLPSAICIGFTGTPLLNNKKPRWKKIFGDLIHQYKYCDAINDKISLPLRYELRDCRQYMCSSRFDVKHQFFNKYYNDQMKKNFNGLLNLLSFDSSILGVCYDISVDFIKYSRLSNGQGNAILVCNSVLDACLAYGVFQMSNLQDKCAIISNYIPDVNNINQDSGSAIIGSEVIKCRIYENMIKSLLKVSNDEALTRSNINKFEQKAISMFVDQPSEMKLLILVDKIPVGFNAPAATNIYLDKKLVNNDFLQAICLVNRLDFKGSGKNYGYVIDYKNSCEALIRNPDKLQETPFCDYRANDISGLLTAQQQAVREDLDNALLQIEQLCESFSSSSLEVGVYLDHFVACDNNKFQRNVFYKLVARAAASYVDYFHTFGEYDVIKNKIKTYIKIKKAIMLSVYGAQSDRNLDDNTLRLYKMYIEDHPCNIILSLQADDLWKAVKDKNNGLLVALSSFMENDYYAALVVHNNVIQACRSKKFQNSSIGEVIFKFLNKLLCEKINLQEYLQFIAEQIQQTEAAG